MTTKLKPIELCTMFSTKLDSLAKIVEDLGISNPELCKLCFEPGEMEDYFECKLCPIERKKGSGYSNLLTHRGTLDYF